MDVSNSHDNSMEKGEILMSLGDDRTGLGKSQGSVSNKHSAPINEATEGPEKGVLSKIQRFFSNIRKGKESTHESFLQIQPVVRTCNSSQITAHRVSNTKISLVEQCPAGYPRLAGFLSSDENFKLYRRFDYLQARLILYKQDELRELEGELDHLDAIDKNEDSCLLRSREKDDALSGQRKILIGDIEQKFNEYGCYPKNSEDREYIETER